MPTDDIVECTEEEDGDAGVGSSWLSGEEAGAAAAVVVVIVYATSEVSRRVGLQSRLFLRCVFFFESCLLFVFLLVEDLLLVDFFLRRSWSS